jgi:hypothetical protein
VTYRILAPCAPSRPSLHRPKVEVEGARLEAEARQPDEATPKHANAYAAVGEGSIAISFVSRAGRVIRRAWELVAEESAGHTTKLHLVREDAGERILIG